MHSQRRRLLDILAWCDECEAARLALDGLGFGHARVVEFRHALFLRLEVDFELRRPLQLDHATLLIDLSTLRIEAQRHPRLRLILHGDSRGREIWWRSCSGRSARESSGCECGSRLELDRRSRRR